MELTRHGKKQHFLDLQMLVSCFHCNTGYNIGHTLEENYSGNGQVEEASAPEAGQADEAVANPVLLELRRRRQPIGYPEHTEFEYQGCAVQGCNQLQCIFEIGQWHGQHASLPAIGCPVIFSVTEVREQFGGPFDVHAIELYIKNSAGVCCFADP